MSSLKPSSNRIVLANGTCTSVQGVIENMPISFDETELYTNFLVLEKLPFPMIIGCTTMKELQAVIDLGCDSINVTLKDRTVTPQLIPFNFQKTSKLGLHFTSNNRTRELTGLPVSIIGEEEKTSKERFILKLLLMHKVRMLAWRQKGR